VLLAGLYLLLLRQLHVHLYQKYLLLKQLVNLHAPYSPLQLRHLDLPMHPIH
jgi:hypothetical protein